MEPRTKNFSPEDINILLDLVKKKSFIIECKQTDKVNTNAKDKAWAEIEQKFNSVATGPKRSQKILRTKYFNMKADLKKRAAAEKRSRYGTGGGPPLKQIEEPFDDMLKNIIPDKQIDGLPSIYDSDYVVETLEIDYENEPQCSEDFTEEIPFPDQLQATASSNAEKDFPAWDCYNPEMLKSEKNKKLKFGQNELSKKNSWGRLAEIKAKWTETKLSQEVDALKAENELRMDQMIELHEMKKRFMLEKHKIELTILENNLTESI